MIYPKSPILVKTQPIYPTKNVYVQSKMLGQEVRHAKHTQTCANQAGSYTVQSMGTPLLRRFPN